MAKNTVFKISSMTSSFTARTVISIPGNNTHTEQSFKGDFNILPQDEIDDILGGNYDDEDTVADRVFKGWKKGEIEDEDGSDLEPTDENIAKLMNIPYFRAGVVQTYIDNVGGRKQRRKN